MAIFLSDKKPQDLEDHSDHSKNDDESRSSAQSYSMEPDSKVPVSPIRTCVKWALICTLVVLAMTFTLELFEPQSSKACRSLRKTMILAY